MKKYIISGVLCLTAWILMLYSDKAACEPQALDKVGIAISTNCTRVSWYNRGRQRRYYLIVNTGSTVVYHSTSQITAANYTTKGATAINASYGFWEDTYLIYFSTWYACTASGTSTVSVREGQ